MVSSTHSNRRRLASTSVSAPSIGLRFTGLSGSPSWPISELSFISYPTEAADRMGSIGPICVGEERNCGNDLDSDVVMSGKTRRGEA